MFFYEFILWIKNFAPDFHDECWSAFAILTLTFEVSIFIVE